MEIYFVPALQVIATILAVFGMIWKFRKDIITEVDKKFDNFKSDVDKRFDKIEARLEAIQQNHLDPITQLHVRPDVGTPSSSQDKTQ